MDRPEKFNLPFPVAAVTLHICARVEDAADVLFCFIDHGWKNSSLRLSSCRL